MSAGLPLLSLVIWVPIAAGIAVLATGSDRNAGLARVLALIGALAGFFVSLPLYAGGGVSASTRQASRAMEQAEYELDGKTRETLIELRRQFSACLSGVSKLRAYQKALTSAEALVVSTRQSILGGERVNLDALNAEQQLYTTRRDLAQARYDYLMAWTKLHYYAGTLREEDLARVDEAFGQRTGP